MPEPRISFKGVSKRYDKLWALREVDVDFQPGEVVSEAARSNALIGIDFAYFWIAGLIAALFFADAMPFQTALFLGVLVAVLAGGLMALLHGWLSLFDAVGGALTLIGLHDEFSHNGVELRYRHGLGDTGVVEGALGGDWRWPTRAGDPTRTHTDDESVTIRISIINHPRAHDVEPAITAIVALHEHPRVQALLSRRDEGGFAKAGRFLLGAPTNPVLCNNVARTDCPAVDTPLTTVLTATATGPAPNLVEKGYSHRRAAETGRGVGPERQLVADETERARNPRDTVEPFVDGVLALEQRRVLTLGGGRQRVPRQLQRHVARERDNGGLRSGVGARGVVAAVLREGAGFAERAVDLVFSSPSTSIKIEFQGGEPLLNFERVRDFLLLHYVANQRDDSEMWLHFRNLTLPDSLKEKISAWTTRGLIIRYEFGVFLPPSWIAVMLGQNLRPRGYDRRVDAVSEDALAANAAAIRRDVDAAVRRTPEHAAFIAQIGGASGTAALSAGAM